MDATESLVDATATRIAQQTRGLLAGRTTRAQWERQVLATIRQAQSQAFQLGTAQRLGLRPDSALLNSRNLSQAERAVIREATDIQQAYLAGFTRAIASGQLSDAQIRARAISYADSIRHTLSRAATAGADLPFHPGDGGTECLTHCRCQWHARDGLWYWVLDTLAEHCDGCRARADGSPYDGGADAS